MDADFGILPGPSPEYNPLHISDQDLQLVIEDLLKEPQPPAAPVPACFTTESDVVSPTTPGGPPSGGGWETAHVGFGFNASENSSLLPPSTLPSVPFSFSLDPPSSLTPPEARSVATTLWNHVTPPNTTFYSPTAPAAVPTTAHLSVPNGNLSGTSAGLYGHGSSVTCGPAPRNVLGEETNQLHANREFSFPSGQPLHPSPGVSHHPFPIPAFAPARAQYPLPRAQYPLPREQYLLPRAQYPFPRPQYPLPRAQYPFPRQQYPLPSRQEFVQESSPDVPPGHWLPSTPASRPATSIPFQLTAGYAAAVPRPPAPLNDSGYASASYVYGEILTPGDKIMEPSALPSVPGKRRADLLCSSPPKTKAVGVSADSSPSPLASSNAASRTHIPPPSFSSRPSPFINGGYASTSDAYGGIPAPDRGIAGPSASPPVVLGKRKADTPCSPQAPDAKAARVSIDSRPFRPPFVQAREYYGPPAFRSRTIVTHKVDWSQRQAWAGKEIDEIDIRDVCSHLGSTHHFGWDKIVRCEWNGCGKEYTKSGALKSHVMGTDHMDLRRECLRCGFSARLDNFSGRHLTKAQCNKYLGRKKKRAQTLAGNEAREDSGNTESDEEGG